MHFFVYVLLGVLVCDSINVHGTAVRWYETLQFRPGALVQKCDDGVMLCEAWCDRCFCTETTNDSSLSKLRTT